MPSWSPDQYLQFAEQRNRPCHDLIGRIAVRPRSIIDLGSGPGNSTAAIAARWPEAEITGIDSSAEMIAAARERDPARHWMAGDIDAWARHDPSTFDLVFSNAALQWLRQHDILFPLLFRHVSPSGALAVQIPSTWDFPAHTEMRSLAASPRWSTRMERVRKADWHTEQIACYYDALVPLAARLDLWETEYLHILDSVEAIVEWYRGTGLRPFLDALASEEERTAFVEEYAARIRPFYSPRADGRVLFPFRRMFIVAYAA